MHVTTPGASLALLHRRLTVAMALSALAAFAAGAGLPLAVSALTGVLLTVALLWQPDPVLSGRIERVVLAITAVLVLWALYQVFVLTDDVVAPVVALLLVLLVGEALRSLDAKNDVRLYTLSFALLVAATAYLPGVVFAAAFVAYVLLATLALLVGHLRREAERQGRTYARLDRTMLRTTVALSLVTLGMGVLVFMAFPRLPRNIFGRGITTPGVSMAGFGDEVSLGAHGARIYPNPEIVLRVEFPDADSTVVPNPARVASMYWRGRSYDEFDGVRWSRNTRRMPRAWAPDDWYRRWAGPEAERQPDQRVYAGALDARVLFGLHPVLEVLPRSDFRPIGDAVGDMAYVTGGAPVYTVRSGRESPSADQLRLAVPGLFAPPRVARTLPDRLDQVAAEYYLQLPDRLPGRVRALADSLTAGLPTQHDRVVAIERWLESNFRYTLDLPATRAEATLEHFLFERRAGHCEYFSTALAVLLRAAGVPARNVNGFMGGEWNDFGRYLAVTQNDAHSWVEVWYTGIGWVRFDATPAGGAAGRVAGTGLLAPLRSLFNGMQHRWSKWVIDYNLDRQVELFGRIGDMFSREPAAVQAAPEAGRPARPWRMIVFLIASAAVLLLIVHLARIRGPALRMESRLYLELRSAYARSGWELSPRRRDGRAKSLGPLEWVSALKAAEAPESRAAERFTRRYLDARYGNVALGADDVRALRATLDRIRSKLRAAPQRG